MAFTVNDFEDLRRLLAAHPEWRAELRPLILGDEFEELPARIARVERELEEIREILAGVAETLRQIAQRQDRSEGKIGSIEGTLGRFEGRFLELKYFQQFGSWFGKYVRGARQAVITELEQVDRALGDGVITQNEIDRLYDLDFLVQGRSKATQEDLFLAVEVSTTVRLDDVLRADERAQTLRRAGYSATGFVGGASIDDVARTRAEELAVLVDLHPSVTA
ncbi:MAG: hypothetical protein WED87_00275 [Dehalococcoidia bacterium]